MVETPTIETPTIEPLVGSYLVEVVSEYPHDPSAYTQGLELHDGLLLESTGRYGESDRRLVQPETGEILESEPLADDQFGEGLTVVGDRVIQLTWTNGIAIVSDEDSLDTTTTFSYSGEGWGLCFDGRHLVMSDGSATLTIRDPDSFDIVRTVAVADNGVPVPLLNELECRAGQVLANVYGSDTVVVVSPSTGAIDARIDLGSLRPSDLPIDDLDYALNGIAFDARSDRFFVTGKSWPVLYEVSLVPNREG